MRGMHAAVSKCPLPRGRFLQGWDKGEWVEAKFRLEKFIVKKVDFPKTLAMPNENNPAQMFLKCTAPHLAFKPSTNYDEMKVFSSCISVQRLGKAEPSFYHCQEYHALENGKWNVTFTCGNPDDYLTFKPNGRIHRVSLSNDLSSKPEKDYKDSHVIGVGRCAAVK